MRRPSCCSAEIRGRFRYLADVGLGYLTLDRQSRTLSGGEVQRINLTTALGTSLVNTLFVLDEPSIGLHPRDMQRVIAVMKRLRDAGNSLVVVEHDPQIMLEADRILDLGPGAGERGGEVVFFGSPAAIRGSSASLTGDYLGGRKRVAGGPRSRRARARRRTRACVADAVSNRWLELKGAAEHNLKRRRRAHPAASAWCASPAYRARASRRSSRTCCTRRCSSTAASRPRRPGSSPGSPARN